MGQYSNDSAAMAAIAGPYKIALTGLPFDLAFLLHQQANIFSVSVSDSVATVFANLDVLTTLGNLAGITLTDPGTPAPPLTYARYISDAATLNLISTPLALSLTGVPVADVAAVQSDTRVTHFTVSDTTAQVFAALDALNADAALTAIALTDATAPVQLSYQQFTADQTALGKIVSPYSVTLSGITVAQAQSVAGYPDLHAITISDTAADVAAALDFLETSPVAIGGITLTDGGTPTLALSYGQYSADQSVLSSITGSYALTVSGVTVANAAVLLADDPHVTGLSIADTAANVAVALNQLDNLPIGTITLTDGPDPTLTLSGDEYDREIGAPNNALAKITGPYQLVAELARNGSFFTQTAGMTVDGHAGYDQIFDEAANVSIIAGYNDNIDTFADNATIILHSGFGQVQINNFDQGGVESSFNDVLQLDQSVFTDWAHVLADTTYDGNDLTITLDPTDSITLTNVSLASFTQSSVKFV